MGAPEEAGFLPVKAFSVPVEALEMVYEEEEFVVDEAHPQELQVPLALDHHPLQGGVWDIHGHDPWYHGRRHQGYFPVNWSLWEVVLHLVGSREGCIYSLGSEGNRAH